jgi:hypothetical protein
VKSEKADCNRCQHRKGVTNRAFNGPRIPDGPGKCTRPGGFCEAKLAAKEGNQCKQ